MSNVFDTECRNNIGPEIEITLMFKTPENIPFESDFTYNLSEKRISEI